MTTIEIELPPDIAACATCDSPLIWLYSFRTGRTFAAVPAPGDPIGFRAHECRHAQDYVTWRAISAQPGPGQQRINAAGRQRAESAIKTKPRIEEKE